MKHDSEPKNLTFKFRGVTYECIGEGKEHQHHEFTFLTETQDWVTLSNRVINQLKFGPYLKIIEEQQSPKEFFNWD